MSSIEYDNSHINMDLKDMSTNVGKLTQMTKELTEKSDKLST